MSQEQIKKRIEWLAVLQGFAMLLVVVGHAWLTSFVDPDHPYVTKLIGTIYHFHMPLFFAISGYLYWITKLGKSVELKTIIWEKVKRLLIPYVTFTIAALSLKVALPQFIQRKSELSNSYFFHILLYPGDNPLGELWFVAVLFQLFLPAALYRVLVGSKLSGTLALIAFFAIGNYLPIQIEVLCFSKCLHYLPFFFFGIVAAKFSLLEFGRNHIVVASGGVLTVLIEILNVYYPNLGAFLPVTWLMFILFFAPIAGRRNPGLFSSFRNVTFQIFLIGIFAQIPVRIIYRRFDSLYTVFFLISILAGIYIPVYLVKLYKGLLPKWAFPLIGL